MICFLALHQSLGPVQVLHNTQIVLHALMERSVGLDLQAKVHVPQGFIANLGISCFVILVIRRLQLHRALAVNAPITWNVSLGKTEMLVTHTNAQLDTTIIILQDYAKLLQIIRLQIHQLELCNPLQMERQLTMGKK